MNKALSLLSFSILSFTLLFFTPIPLLAKTFSCSLTPEGDPQTREAGGIFEYASDCCVVIGECSSDDFAIVAFAIIRIVFAAAGVIALLFFIAGGVFMIISGGNQVYISRGKMILRSALIGLAIIFLAWIIVNLIVIAVTGSPTGILFNQEAWYVFRTSN